MDNDKLIKAFDSIEVNRSAKNRMLNNIYTDMQFSGEAAEKSQGGGIIKQFIGMAAALVIILGGGVLLYNSINGSISNDGVDYIQPAVESEDTSYSERDIAEAVKNIVDEIYANSDDDFYKDWLNQIHGNKYDLTIQTNTFDFDVNLLEVYGDSKNTAALFEFVPKNGFEFKFTETEEGSIWVDFGLAWLEPAVKKFAVLKDDDDFYKGGGASSSGMEMYMKDDILYVKFDYAANNIRVVGEKFRLGINDTFSVHDPQIPGVLELTFTADYEPMEMLTFEYDEPFTMNVYDNEMPVNLRKIMVSDYSVSIYISGHELGYQIFGSQNRFRSDFYGLADIKIRFTDGREGILFSPYSDVYAGFSHRRGMYSTGDANEMNHIIVYGVFNEIINANEIEAIIISGVEFKLK